MECPGCGGDGRYGEGESSRICGVCHGIGTYEPNEAHTVVLKLIAEAKTAAALAAEKAVVLETLLVNLSPTCKVAGCMNSTEYLALVDAAKDGVKIVLSCGFVDMREGQWARTTRWSIFGEARLTRAALIAIDPS